jgi:calcineurin-like phosphoesterase family protein
MYIISDTHFGHINILLFEPGRIQKARMEGYEDFDRFLIETINDVISKEDEVLHLGDVTFKDGYKLAKKLNGKITLIKGNHDKEKHIKFYKSLGWDIIDGVRIEAEVDEGIKKYIESMKYRYKKFEKVSCLIKNINGKRVLFSHYPVFNDNPYDEKFRNITNALEEIFNILNCDINVYGHTHSYIVGDKKCINACLEVNDFKPLKIEEIL